MKIGALLQMSDPQVEDAFRQAILSPKDRPPLAELDTHGFEDIDTSSIKSERSFLDESFASEISMSGLLATSKADLNQSASFLAFSRKITSLLPELPSLLSFRKQESDEFQLYRKNVYEVRSGGDQRRLRAAGRD